MFSKDNIFETKENSIYTTIELILKLEKSNYEILPDGSLDALLFGSVVICMDKENTTKTITLGTRVVIPIYSNEQILDDTDPNHTIIHFEEGDCFIKNRHVPKSIDNVNDIFETLTKGHLSNLVEYHKYYEIIMNTMKTNEMLGFPKILLEMMLGEMFINEKGEKVRRTGESFGLSASIDDVVQTAGAFNSMTFEDSNKSILINKGKSKEQQQQSSKIEEFFRK